MYLILKRDLIHPYLDKSKTRILGRREYLLVLLYPWCKFKSMLVSFYFFASLLYKNGFILLSNLKYGNWAFTYFSNPMICNSCLSVLDNRPMTSRIYYFLYISWGWTQQIVFSWQESIYSISFSNKGSRYLCSGGSGHIVRIWDLQRKRCIKWLSGHTDTITGVMYNCKDEHLASISMKGDLILHNLASGARAAELSDPNGQVIYFFL